jgi:hypothetical protein
MEDAEEGEELMRWEGNGELHIMDGLVLARIFLHSVRVSV